jgi:hypothetical protein
MPALPLDSAGPYVAGAYLVFLALVLIYVGIMASKLARIDRELSEIAELTDRRTTDSPVAGSADQVTADDSTPISGAPERVA